MTELNPDQTLRRSPLYRRHVQLDAQFEPLGDALVVGAYSDTGMEPRLGVSLGLADLCCLPRTGFKGHGAPDWAAGSGGRPAFGTQYSAGLRPMAQWWLNSPIKSC
jgi:hypothetical protein